MRRLAAGLICALFVAGACQAEQPDPESFPARTPLASPTSADALVVGLVGTLSGPDAWRGEDAFEGADLAVHELNSSGPNDGPTFELVSLDDRGDPARATQLVRQLAASDRTVGIIYAGPTEGLPRAETALADAGIPALACYGDLYSSHELSAHVFQLAPSYLWEGRRIARYLIGDRRYRRVGALVTDTAAGEVAVDALGTAFQEAGSRLSFVGRVATDDFNPFPKRQLQALKRHGVEAIVVEGDGAAFKGVLEGLRSMGALYRSTDRARIATAPSGRLSRSHARRWRPQVVALDAAMSTTVDPSLLVPGTVVAETYARGAHYLPVPSFRSFSQAFRAWWESEPLGWQRRSYEGALALGWARHRADEGDDLAKVLETLRGERFGGLDVTFGPDDHTSVDATTVGLWVIPRSGIPVRERDDVPEDFPWVPLSRGFSIDGQDTDIMSRDWRYLVRNPPDPNGPAPKIWRVRFGVATKRSDPIH